MKIEVKRKRLTFAMGQQKKLRSNLSQRIAASLLLTRSSVQKICTKGHKMLGFRSREADIGILVLLSPLKNRNEAQHYRFFGKNLAVNFELPPCASRGPPAKSISGKIRR